MRTARPRRRRAAVALAVVGLIAGALAAAVAARGPLFFLSCDIDDLLAQPIGRATQVYAADGSLLATIGREQRYEPVPLAEIAPALVGATIAAEDRRFYDHGGVDYAAVARALVADAREGEVVQGGSTITQQLVRTLDGDGGGRSVGRKLEEACLAVEIERRWSKDRILEAYLNQIYYGNRAYGIEAAARTYFSKSAKELTLEEAALLAGLPRAPSRLDPLTSAGEALAVREDVLAALRDVGDISDGRFERSRRARLGLRPSPAFRGRDGEVADAVLAELVEVYGAATVRRGGLRVRTTIDPRLQRLARAAVRRTLNRRSDPAAALVAMNPKTGAIRAMVSVVPGREEYAFNLAVHRPGRVVELAQAMGIESRLNRVPSVGLGTGEVSVLETATAFSTLASGGLRPRPLLVRRVVLADGRVDREAGWGKPEKERVLPAAVAHHATRVLEANLSAGTGTAARIGRPAAGKTGTTENHADAWFAGYTPDLAAVVWMGHPGAVVPMENVHGIAVVGGSFPALIWRRFAGPALAALPPRDWPAPSGRIDWERFCGRFQFALTAAAARPKAGCPERPKRRPPTERREPETTTHAAPPATITAPPTTQAPPPPPPPTTTAPQPPTHLVGRHGIATSTIDNAVAVGEVDIGGELWPARSETGEVIPAGAEVEVVRVDARLVYVAPV